MGLNNHHSFSIATKTALFNTQNSSPTVPITVPITRYLDVSESNQQPSNTQVPRSDFVEQWVCVDDIQPGALQPRQYCNELELDDLATVFKIQGFKGILNVRPLKGNRYELVAGERRWRAAKRAGIQKVLCLVSKFSDIEALQFSLVENIKRVGLSKLEETIAILQLIEMRYGLSQKQTATIIRTEGHPDKRSRHNAAPSQDLQNIEAVLKSFDIELQTFRTRNLRSLTLPDELIQAHLSNQISWSVALELHKLKDATVRQSLLNEILSRESASYRWVQHRVKGLRSETIETSKQPSLGQRLKTVAKQVNAVESRLSVDQQQQLEMLLKQLDELLKKSLP